MTEHQHKHTRSGFISSPRYNLVVKSKIRRIAVRALRCRRGSKERSGNCVFGNSQSTESHADWLIIFAHANLGNDLNYAKVSNQSPFTLTPDMFKKPLSNLKTSAPLRSSDRRKLKKHIVSLYGLQPEEGDILMPEGILSVKFSTHIEEHGVGWHKLRCS